MPPCGGAWSRHLLSASCRRVAVEIDWLTIVMKSGVPTVVAHRYWNTGFCYYVCGLKRRHGRRWVGDSAGGLRSAAINTEATLSMSVGALPTGDKLENPRDVYFQGRATNALFGAVRLLFRSVRSAAVRACPAEVVRGCSAAVQGCSAQPLFGGVRLPFGAVRLLFGAVWLLLGTVLLQFGAVRLLFGLFGSCSVLIGAVRLRFGAARLLFGAVQLLFGAVWLLFS
eukprot:gene2926-biopygen5126